MKKGKVMCKIYMHIQKQFCCHSSTKEGKMMAYAHVHMFVPRAYRVQWGHQNVRSKVK